MPKFQQAGRTSNQAKNDREIVVPAIAAGSNPGLASTKEATPEEAQEKAKEKENQQWLADARDAYRTSEDYFDASIRKKMERNLAHFGNKHAPGSKYYSDAYKYRAKGFRPKTRSVVRRNEAKAAIALFSTSDVVNVAAENDADPNQVVSAELNQELLNYRLDNTIPWFQIAMGAYQDSLVQGVVISRQHWDFQEIESEELIYDENGQTVIDNETQAEAMGTRREIVKDTPRIELRPVENIRFSPSADWDDPLNTSPYLIDLIPMEIGEIKRLAKRSSKTSIPWHNLDEVQLRSGGGTENYDPLRSQREHNRQDSKDQTHLNTDFDVTWVHRNIIRKDGRDWVFYTLGVHYMLSDPIPLTEECPHLKPGERDYVLGVSSIETHIIYPESVVGLSASLQQEANDINNQRRDNVALVLNKRYFARRDAQINYKNLKMSVPGGVVEMDNIEKDIKSEEFNDVTSSAYQEQDRVNMDFDELAGSFSQSSVSANRKLNERVGNMEMMSADADEITEYQLRMFVQTWVKPVLKQIIRLEQRFESDEAILALMGEKVKLWERFGIDRVTDAMLRGSMKIQVNVGFGATNPRQRIEKLTMGLTTVLQFSPEMAQRASGDEIAKEVFGALGYDGADRFFPPQDPENMPEQQEDPRVAVAKMRAQIDQMKIESAERLAGAKLQDSQAGRQMAQDTSLALADLDKQLKIMVQKGVDRNKLQELQASIGELVLSIRSSQKIAGVKAKQLPKPPYEPPGRAQTGMSAVQ